MSHKINTIFYGWVLRMSSGVSQSEKSSPSSNFVQRGNQNPQTAKVPCSSFTIFASLITSDLKTALFYTVDILLLADSKCEGSYVSVTKIKTKTAKLVSYCSPGWWWFMKHWVKQYTVYRQWIQSSWGFLQTLISDLSWIWCMLIVTGY